jgi:hydrogenase expression/formation protein HypE
MKKRATRKGIVLPEGKLLPDVLDRLLRYTSRSPLIEVGAACGEDAAVAAGAKTLVLTADPITFTEERIGAYVVAVNANDVVAMGGRPQYLTTTILLPPGTTSSRLERVFAEVSEASAKAGLLWVGGHTEVTGAVNRVVISGHAVGFLRRKPLSTSGARPGDAIGLTKWVGLEGTTLIARERPAETERILGKKGYRAVLSWLEKPGISIVEEGRVLEGLSLTSGHDPTEGGVAMGIQEVCRRSGAGAMIFYESLPLREETRLLCHRFRLDPLGLLSSGVFLFTAHPVVVARAGRMLSARGIPCSIIGEVLNKSEGVWLVREGRRERLRASAQDEIVKLAAAG